MGEIPHSDLVRSALSSSNESHRLDDSQLYYKGDPDPNQTPSLHTALKELGLNDMSFIVGVVITVPIMLYDGTQNAVCKAIQHLRRY
jgi:hypothetical protein